MGFIEIWGNIVPNLLAMAGKTLRQVSESIPLSGYNLKDSVVFGLSTMKAETLRGNLLDSVLFSAVFKTSETLGGLADSVVFGVTKTLSESPPIAESVAITNV